MPLDFIGADLLEPSPESKRGAKYITADGSIMTNAGQKRVSFRTKEGTTSSIVFQATGVRKPLASVSRIVERGNRVVFDPSGSYIENAQTGARHTIEKESGTFVMNVDISPGFTRRR